MYYLLLLVPVSLVIFEVFVTILILVPRNEFNRNISLLKALRTSSIPSKRVFILS